MYTLILAVLSGVAAGLASRYGFKLSTVWSVTIGVFALLAVQVAITLILRKLTNRINADIQKIMLETQQKLQQKQAHFMRRPTNQKMMMTQLEKDQTDGLKRSLEEVKKFEPICKWNFFLKKQVNTMNMMFNYQLKNYEEVDKLLPHCMYMDNQSIAIRMARMYKTKAPAEELDKFFKKKCKRMKGENVVLPYSLYTWILLKQGRDDDAFKVMTDAKAKTADENIQKNWELLANGKVKQFSNSGLGDVWYALALEEPKMPKVQQVYRRY